MPRQRQYYDPIIEIPGVQPETVPEPAANEVQGIYAGKPGLYLHVDDVIATLLRMAAETPVYGEPLGDIGQEALLAAAESFRETSRAVDGGTYSEPGPEALSAPEDAVVVYELDHAPVVFTPPPLPEVDPFPAVARIEVFPEETSRDADPSGNPRWRARSVDAMGNILETTDGSFDRDYVERDAQTRWPGKKVYGVSDAMGDSIWDEQAATHGFNGRRRPSPRRLWG